MLPAERHRPLDTLPGGAGRKTQEAEKEPAPCGGHGGEPAGEACSRQPASRRLRPPAGGTVSGGPGRPPPGMGAVGSRSLQFPHALSPAPTPAPCLCAGPQGARGDWHQ